MPTIAPTTVVLPISDELNCQRCHADNGDAGPNIATGSIELKHPHQARPEERDHPDDSQPVLCANCHLSNALCAPGQSGRKSLSKSMHTFHAGIAGDQPGCYDCHPGPKTHRLRSAVVGMQPVGADPNCQQCHDELASFAQDLHNGREPWVTEPKCTQCHGKAYDTGNQLYRDTQGGHGANNKLYCAACHNSPHARWPSKLAVNDVQPLRMQGTPNPVCNCGVCHTNSPAGDNPHVGLNFATQ